MTYSYSFNLPLKSNVQEKLLLFLDLSLDDFSNSLNSIYFFLPFSSE